MISDNDTLEGVAGILAQLDEESLRELDSIFAQTSAYVEPVTAEFFAQVGASAYDEASEDLQLVASYLSQLSGDEIDKLSNLVQTKKASSATEFTTSNAGDVELHLAQDNNGYSAY